MLYKVIPVTYEGVGKTENIGQYAAGVRDEKGNYDGPIEDGIIVSPYHTLDINGTEVPVYSTRCGMGVHSFARVDVTDEEFVLRVSIRTQKTYEAVLVLPESSGVTAEADGNVFTAQIHAEGNYTFVFDKNPNEAALTLFVSKEKPFEAPAGYAVRYMEAGQHSIADTSFTQSNTVYYFKAGRHYIDSISLVSDTVLYLERGAYLETVETEEGKYLAAVTATDAENVRIEGRGLFDFSACTGGDAKTKGVFSFERIKGGSFEGITVINSNNWTLCYTTCEDIHITDCMFFGYRTYSDGIMLSDCKNSGASDCFLRTGDDAVEVKSTGGGGVKTENILYERCTVWTDKAKAFGAIYECNNDLNGVLFRDCSVGFAQPTWTEKLGVCTVEMGDTSSTHWENIRFEKIEVYRNECALINIHVEGRNGSGGQKLTDVYFRDIASEYCYGLPVRIFVASGCTLGTVYIDNVRVNGMYIEEEHLTDKTIFRISNANAAWKAEKNVKVNASA